MYKKYVSASGTAYVFDSCTNNIYEIDDKEKFASLPTVGDSSALRLLDPEFFDSYYGKSYTDPTLMNEGVIAQQAVPEVLVLEVTQQCNFRCEYCVFSGHYFNERTHTDLRMELPVADRIIDTFFRGHEDSYPANVSFYGGEPLTNFKVIQYVVDTLTNLHLNVEYYITTNGSLLLNQKIFDYLVDHQFHINISYDGVNQDLYRKTISGDPTASTVEQVVTKLVNEVPEYTSSHIHLSITLAPPYYVQENYLYFKNHPVFSKVKVVINSLNTTDNDFVSQFDMAEESNQMSRDYHNLAEEYIRLNDKDASFFLHGLFTRSIGRIEDRCMGFRHTQARLGCCEPGQSRLFITCDGQYRMCERVGSFAPIGSIYKGFDLSAAQRVQQDFDAKILPECHNCYLSSICDFCYAAFHEGDSLISEAARRQYCEHQRNWYDLVFYVFLSRSERKLNK